MKKADVLHLPGNTSDHCPVYCKIEMDGIDIKQTTNQKSRNNAPIWKKASPEQKEIFVIELDEKLRTITTPSSRCRNVHCNDPGHILDCDRYLMDILEAIRDVAFQCLPSNNTAPKVKNRKSKVMDWKENVQPFRDDALFWNAVWTSAGKPINTALHQVMKRTRNIYHYQIRKSRKMTECVRRNTLLDACINNNGDIFKEIRKLRATSPTISSVIDGNNSILKVTLPRFMKNSTILATMLKD